MNWTLDNITVLFSKITELYGFIALAFKSEVGWSWSNSADQAIQNSNGQSKDNSSYYIYIFWGCVFLSIAFFSLIFPAAKRARKGTLGQASDGTQAKFTNKEFWIAKIMNILGGAAYLVVITNLIEIFACNFDSDPWTLYSTNSIECYNAEHFLYLIVTIIAVLLYYPLATLMFPNLQFSNRMVDVKFTPSFMVLISQTKLFIAGIAVFLRSSNSVTFRLSISSALFLFLWYENYKMKPCVVVSTNLWFGAGYFLAFWINLCAIIVPTLHSDILALSLMGLGVVCISGITIFLHIRRNRTSSKKRKKRSYKQVVPFSMSEDAIDKSNKKTEDKPEILLRPILKKNDKDLANLNSISSDSEEKLHPKKRVDQSLDDSEEKLNFEYDPNIRGKIIKKSNNTKSSNNSMSKDDNSQSLIDILNKVKPKSKKKDQSSESDEEKQKDKINIKLNSSDYNSEEEDDIDNERQLKYYLKPRVK